MNGLHCAVHFKHEQELKETWLYRYSITKKRKKTKKKKQRPKDPMEPMWKNIHDQRNY